MKTEVLRMLKEAEGYISGQEICEKFNVSRTAVWKVIKQLETEGYLIEAVRNKGYRLKMAGDILSRAEIESSMNTKWAGKKVLYFDETGSTNTEAKQAAEARAPHGPLAVADYENMGNGRRGRMWTSPRGVGVWMSLMIRPEIHPSAASMLTLVAALAVSEGIGKTCGLETQIKWPNDIVADGKKICGILTEMSTELECINYVVTGMGINANMEELPEEIKDVATSILLQTGKRVKRSQLIGAVMESYEKYYNVFMESGNMSGLLDVYNSHLANMQRSVRVLQPGSEYVGTALGINDAGELLVNPEDGAVHQVIAGEVSGRGIYGYV